MSTTDTTCIVRFDRDLRLTDHPALVHAAERADALLPVYVRTAPDTDWPPNDNQLHWRARSLRELADRLDDHDLPFAVLDGPPADSLPPLADQIDADAVYWNRRYRPDARRRGDEAADRLREAGVEVERYEATLMHDPDAVETTSGGPYHVYTPFWNKFRDVVDVSEPLPEPDLDAVSAPGGYTPDTGPDALAPAADPAAAFDDWWTPGARSARTQLDDFLADVGAAYDEQRDQLGVDGTSRLSPRFRHGELSPRQVWHATERTTPDGEAPDDVHGTFRQELVWREFSYHLLHHYPETATEPLKEKFRDFRWRRNPTLLQRWREGRTGYPIVDAGMRQLRRTGWMHNRARMIVASFLTKDLRLHWRHGAETFWEHLVDADLANNTMGWQWAAGTGADAQPFFRIFNPVSQGERHDPNGEYVRRWVPELSELDDDVLHAPWKADASDLREAGVELDDDYPAPIVDHADEREASLAEWERIK
ncbi:MAG: deoxyribodipyrimidine photo-lyase [Bradymonadaceae bacterium]